MASKDKLGSNCWGLSVYKYNALRTVFCLWELAIKKINAHM